ncbi:hypothetical protein GGU45_000215 [Niabella hirudinis]
MPFGWVQHLRFNVKSKNIKHQKPALVFGIQISGYLDFSGLQNL